MLKFSACIEMLFSDRPFAQRIPAAKAMGLDAFEFWGWSNKNLAEIQEAAALTGLPIAACCVDSANERRRAAYQPLCMLEPANAALYAEMVDETCETMGKLGIKTFISTVGQERFDVSRQAQHDAIITCASAAAPILAKHGFTLVIEPLNILVDHIGYYLARSSQALEIVDAVGSPNVKILYDVYHQQITEGNLIDTISANVSKIGHIHIADVPGRHEPGTGEIDYHNVFAAIERSGYAAYVGMEYMPTDVGHEQSVRGMLEIYKG